MSTGLRRIRTTSIRIGAGRHYDIRNRVNINGTILAVYGIRLSPNITYNSAPPWNLVEGVDQLGDAITGNARPAFDPAGFSRSGVHAAARAES